MVINLGNKDYASKAAVRRRAQELLSSYNEYHPGSEAFAFLYDLFCVHPRKDEKMGPGVLYFSVTRAPGDEPNFVVHRTDGAGLDFSFHKCLNALGRTPEEIRQTEYKRHLDSAYRTAVWDDVKSFRETQPRTCSICNASVQGQLIEVDHIEPTFAELVHMFEDQCSIPKPQGFEECGQGVGYHPCARRFRKTDAAYEQVWVAFHRANARLRLVCAACNMKRSRKER